MWKKVAIAAGTGAAVLGVGVAAMAETGSTSSSSPSASTPSGSTSASAPAKAGKHEHGKRAGARLRALEHGEWVSRTSSGGTETHDAVHGTVLSVSPTSISVRAADGYRLTFTVNSDTKVRVLSAGSTDRKSATKGTIAQVKSGDTVLVSGTKSGNTVTAKHVLDGTG